jgi:hypothetical protein
LQIDRTALTDPVRRALNDPRVQVESWTATPLGGGFAMPAGGILRLAGTCSDGLSVRPWTLVLKEIVPPGGDSIVPDDPSEFSNWRREPLAYASGLLDDLPGGLVAPRCYGVEERPDGRYWLWLEDVGAIDVLDWTLETYALAARHLGAFNGACLLQFSGARPSSGPLSPLGEGQGEGVPVLHNSEIAVNAKKVPDFPWLNRDYLAKYLAQSPHERAGVALLRDPATWQFARAREAFPPATVERLLRLWACYPDLIAASRRLPRTLAHLDAHRRNLLPRLRSDGARQIVAIDWAAIGLASIGADAAQLAIATLVFDEVSVLHPGAFAEHIFEAYLKGLRDAGWRGPRGDVRQGFATFAIVRWALNVASLILENLAATDPSVRADTEAWLGRPIQRILSQWQGVLAYLLDLAEDDGTG